MGCQGCKKFEEPTGLEYVWNRPTADFVVRGTTYRIDQPLVMRPHAPSVGWGVNFRINGQRMSVPGRTPGDVLKNAKALFKTNGIAVTDLTLWLNLNVLWLTASPSKRWVVPLDSLLSIASLPEGEQSKSLHDRPTLPSTQWAPVAADTLRAFLFSEETYDRHDFLGLLKTFLRMADPNRNPGTGNARLYVPLNAEVSKFTKVPPFTWTDACQRVVETLRILDLNRSTERGLIPPVKSEMP